MSTQLDNPELTAQERAAKIVWWLAHGEAMTTRHVAELTGLARSSAWEMMSRIARVIPIYCNKDGEWEVCAMEELAGIAKIE
ncbi:MAG: hypothetical protein DRJ03_08835 [Chloroflexi bacterium]|nr:MAG: hypothetical protein DRJ03_08835 [Chloroflexota bacterium]